MKRRIILGLLLVGFIFCFNCCSEPLHDTSCYEDSDCQLLFYCNEINGKCVSPRELPCEEHNDCPPQWWCSPDTHLCVSHPPEDGGIDGGDEMPDGGDDLPDAGDEGPDAADESLDAGDEDPCSGIDCSGHGTCSGGTCNCDIGYAGADCDQCDVGYIGYPNCQPDPCAGITCSYHGVCSGGVCTCDTGYAGDNCENCAAGYHRDGDECVPDWPYESRPVFALNAAETPFIQNGGESDVIFFSITMQDGPGGFSVLTFEFNCPNGQVSEVNGDGTFYRSPDDGQTYDPITIPGQGAVAKYIPNSNRIRIGFIQEELFLEGETKYYKLSPVMSSLIASEQCVIRALGNAASGPTFLYHPSETSILSVVDGVCYENPPNLIWSDMSAGADHAYPLVDFNPCVILEGVAPYPWGTSDFISGAVGVGAIQNTVTAP